MKLSNLAVVGRIQGVEDIVSAQWGEVKQRIKAYVGVVNFERLFADADLKGIKDKVLVELRVPNQLLKQEIEAHYGEILLNFWRMERPVVEGVRIFARAHVEPPPKPPPEPELPPPVKILQEETGPKELSSIPLEKIQEVVARHYGINRHQLISASKLKRIVLPRQIAMYLAYRVKPSRSLPMLGRLFGGRDHTTVLHAVNRITQMVLTDPELAKDIDLLKEILVGD